LNHVTQSSVPRAIPYPPNELGKKLRLFSCKKKCERKEKHVSSAIRLAWNTSSLLFVTYDFVCLFVLSPQVLSQTVHAREGARKKVMTWIEDA
jgi:hypothetical protein